MTIVIALWHKLWLSLLLSYRLLECFDSILTRTIEMQYCQFFQSHFLLIFVFCWNNGLGKLWNTSLYFWPKSKLYWVGLDTFFEVPLLDRPLSMSLSTLHFLFSVLTESFLFNILKSTTPGRQRKNLKELYFYSNTEWLRKNHFKINWNSIRLNPRVWTHMKKF